jgi:hypothetical protein
MPVAVAALPFVGVTVQVNVCPLLPTTEQSMVAPAAIV